MKTINFQGMARFCFYVQEVAGAGRQVQAYQNQEETKLHEEVV